LYNRFKYTARSCDEFNQLVLKKLGDTLQATGPKFIWAHIAVPHEPFCRDSHGEFLSGGSFDESDSAAVKKKYVGYLQYGNSLIMKLLNEHPELSDKIVIIAGDHGPRHAYLKDKSYQFWPFAAVHIPGEYDTASLRRLVYISQLPAFLMRELSR
jgi:membrane-anchored protein YejM (alkaline phosphatase superfamily)